MTRFIELEGSFNFRDLGGYRTDDGATLAWNRVYRSDNLHRLTETGRVAYAELGVVSVLDLRTPQEVDRHVWRAPGWRHLPILPEPPDWSESRPDLEDAGYGARHYTEMLEIGAESLREAVTALSDPANLPTVFHCAAGKDRTGVLAALILRLLNVPPTTVADDYALSDEATARWVASVQGTTKDDATATWPYIPPSLIGAQHHTMLAFLTAIDDRYGSVPDFAKTLGLTNTTIEKLRHNLLQP